MIAKIENEDTFNEWLINNRHNTEVSDEAYAEMIDFHFHYFRPDIHSPSLSSGLTRQQIEEVKEFFMNGNKLQAVKRFKELSGWGLKESKDWVDTNFGSVAPPPPKPPSLTTGARPTTPPIEEVW